MKGKGWEAEIRSHNRTYRQQGLACIGQCHPPYNRAARKHHAKGPPDFLGVVGAGVSVAFEAKDGNLPGRWPLADLAQHQAEHLSDHHECGGSSFILLKHCKRRYLIPWPALGPVYNRWKDGLHKRGEASVSVAWLEENARPFTKEGGWLEAFDG